MFRRKSLLKFRWLSQQGILSDRFLDFLTHNLWSIYAETCTRMIQLRKLNHMVLQVSVVVSLLVGCCVYAIWWARNVTGRDCLACNIFLAGIADYFGFQCACAWLPLWFTPKLIRLPMCILLHKLSQWLPRDGWQLYSCLCLTVWLSSFYPFRWRPYFGPSENLYIAFNICSVIPRTHMTSSHLKIGFFWQLLC